MSTYETLSLMIIFAMLVIAIINISQKRQKK
ncbi:MAG: putative holin-like toxin [Alkaliphilus sp.]